MIILGIAAPFGHDHSAAILVDGKLIAAAEEERFTRKKHADGQMPINAVKYCVKQAGIDPRDIDRVAYPWSYKALRDKRFEYFVRTIRTKPSRAIKKFFRNNRELADQKRFTAATLSASGIDPAKIKMDWVEHHIAHAASSFYFSGAAEAAVLSIDAGGEITATLMGYADHRGIVPTKQIIAPDSLGDFYSTMTDYLGFERGDGEYKVMGMAPFGAPSKCSIDHIIRWDDRKKTFHCNDDYVWVNRSLRARLDKVYSLKMVREFGPEREGDGLTEPYIHIAAATQKALENISVKLVETYLKEELLKHGNLCFAGGCALNVALNRVLLEQPYIRNLWVQPASGDAGGSVGAAAYVAAQHGEKIEPMRHAYYGPEYSNKEIEEALRLTGYSISLERDIALKAAQLLHEGKIFGWFQGRMEWGPRALGNRSIIGNATIRGTADKINAIIKFRETWRPFCPSILKEYAADILNSTHPAPFMTIAFKANPAWKERIPEVIHIDGTCRPQVVDKETNPRFHRLISNYHRLSGVPVVINTSLNRRGEPMICSPQDALVMFSESGLEYLIMGDYLVKKAKEAA
ncbi:MAG TPA: carbamoyltransferase C-terminal domain-containing protein [Candidatus Omnitrophota bacterium]|nr:carbamoyltransferase C-terminal domain-containing protein [Candidatus Omnitrophota bacterium]